jgi:Arc/MetJ-type ribon-helix-helix transcriptional regulator
MTTKIAVSLPDELVAAARQSVAEGRAASVSAFIAEALEGHGRYGDLAELLADMAAEAGSPTEQDRVWARRALGLG